MAAHARPSRSTSGLLNRIGVAPRKATEAEYLQYLHVVELTSRAPRFQR